MRKLIALFAIVVSLASSASAFAQTLPLLHAGNGAPSGGGGGGGLSVVAASQPFADPSAHTSDTFTGVTLCASGPPCGVIVTIGFQNNGGATGPNSSVTIDGHAATQLVDSSGGNFAESAWAFSPVTNATGNIVVNYTTTGSARSYLGVYSYYGSTSQTGSADTTITGISQSFSGANYFIIGAETGGFSTGTCGSPSNLTSDKSVNIGGVLAFCIGSTHAAETSTLTYSYPYAGAETSGSFGVWVKVAP